MLPSYCPAVPRRVRHLRAGRTLFEGPIGDRRGLRITDVDPQFGIRRCARRICDPHEEAVQPVIGGRRRAGQGAIRRYRQPGGSAQLRKSQRVAIRIGSLAGESLARVGLVDGSSCRGEEILGERGAEVRVLTPKAPDLRAAERAVVHPEVVDAAIEKRVRILALADVIQVGCEVAGVNREIEHGSHGLSVDVECRAVLVKHRGEMHPLSGRQGGGVDLLFGARAIDGVLESQPHPGAGIRRQEDVLMGAGSEIEDPLPIAATVPIHPGGDRHLAGQSHGRGKLDVVVGAIEIEGLTDLAGDIGGRAEGGAVLAAAAAVLNVSVHRVPAGGRCHHPELARASIERFSGTGHHAAVGAGIRRFGIRDPQRGGVRAGDVAAICQVGAVFLPLP